jgi:hypothetical protein
MSDYDLSGLSPRSFERLLQAIAAKVLGPGLTVFGDGPDGGREATFEGKVPFPSAADCWDGYCVVQAKFRQRPDATGNDGRWAMKQLQEELAAFKKSAIRRRPDFYIFVTNVVLTPVAKKGGKDLVNAVFAKHGKALGLRAWRIWDFDQIGTFLDTMPEIRTTYAAWITPGDVLATLLDPLRGDASRRIETLTNFLAKELVRDQFANLGQAGHIAADKIPLARTFVDLPISRQRSSDLSPEDQDDADPREFASLMVQHARERLDSLAAANARNVPVHTAMAAAPEAGRIVLIGGPGQAALGHGRMHCDM